MGGAEGRARGRKSYTDVALRIVLVAAAYYMGARLGLRLAYANRNVTAVWPPTGIAVAALLAWGLRVWPGVAIGAFLANLANGAGAPTAAAIVVGNTCAPVVGALLLRRVFAFRDTLDRLRDVLALLVVGGLLAMSISATGGTAALWLTDAIGHSSIASVWTVWWVGDAIGVVLFAPFLLLLRHLRSEHVIRARPFEALALLLVAGAITLVIFSIRLPLPYLVFVPIIWAAIRFGPTAATWLTVLLVAIAVSETVLGHGPFAYLSPTASLVSLQAFNATVGFTSLVLASIMLERRHAEARLSASERRYRKLFEQAHDFVCIHDRDGRVLYANPSVERMTGYSPERLRSMRIGDLVAPEYIPVVRRTIERQPDNDAQPTTYEVVIVGTSGRRVALEVATTLIQDDSSATWQLIGRDITSRLLAEDQLRHQVLRDPLTDLPNRTLLHERLAFALTLARRDATKVAVAILDLDAFREVNEKHGFHAGDGVLEQIAGRLREGFREPDTVARLEGNTFAVLLPSLARGKEPSVIAEQIRAEIGMPFDVGSGEVDISASIGIAVFPDHATDAETLMQRADIAMYSVKKSGGDTHRIYRSDLDSRNVRRAALLGEIEGLHDERLVLHYQPTIDIATMRTVGVEALVRWVSPALGVVPPAELLPIFESAQRMDVVSERVFTEAFRQCAVWLEAGLELDVAVNVSGPTLTDGSVVGQLRSALDATAVPPDRVVLEIREADAMDGSIHHVLVRMTDIGVKLSIDDFGLGTSSLVKLRRLPFSEIKIDRSFVGGLATNAEDLAIARSIVELGHGLDLTVVAEGVETRDAWSKLVELGCDRAQGFLICRPAPIAELESWLQTPAWGDRVR